MFNHSFKEAKSFQDPLEDCSQTIYSSKFPKHSIFDAPFFENECQKSQAQPTICFDMDGTIRGWDGEKFEGFLRGDLQKLLDKLKQDFRLVIWSATTKNSIQQTINKYPEFEQYFDLFISAEHYCFKFLTQAQKEMAKNISQEYYDLLFNITDEKGKKSGDSHFRPPKDIKIFNYQLLVDDDPNTVIEANLFNYNYLRVTNYSYDNPDIKASYPTKLSDSLDKNFRTNIYDTIISMVER